MRYEDRITIATPEGVDLDVPLAGVGSRVAAYVVDAIIQYLIILAVAVALVVGLGERWGVIFALGLLIWFLVQWGYHVLFEVLASGRTPGKRWLGLRVVRSTGGPVGWRESIIRNLLRLIDESLTMYAAGVVSIVASGRNQRLGDMAAGTLVIRERRGTGEPDGLLQPQFTDDLAVWDVSAVTDDDVSAVRTFLQRRSGLPGAARARIAGELATRLRGRVAGAPEGLEDEVFLWKLYAAKSGRGAS